MLIEQIESYLADSWETKTWSGIWNATDCTGCPRALVYIARGVKPPGKPSPWDIYRMQDGLLHEDDLRARLRLKGIKLEHPGAIMMPDAPIVCHPDDLCNLDGVPYGIEYKSHGCDRFHALTVRGVKDYMPRYYNQMQLYMRATGIKQWILIAKDRNCCRIHEEVVPYDDVVAQRLVDTVLSAQAAISQNLDVQALPCSNDFMTRLFCPFNMTVCEGPAAEVWTPEATKAAEAWLWAKAMEEESSKSRESSRQTFRDIMANLSEPTPAIDVGTSFLGSWVRLRVYASGQRRRFADTALAEKLLEPEVFNRIFEAKELPGPRIYRLKGDSEDSHDD